ncbi:uncharacterized protein LOC143028396 isoform X4 [Oratosquilla oratoria]|uniref:uncharacterized protein LOC143028396 isoform X4 n=1 Tax=Oratosquilla oratoria TaxID=337810 RepID=UPI003F76E296
MMWQLIKTLQDQGKVLPLLVAVLYSSCSAVMAFFNKLIVDTYDFNFPFTILGGQMVTTILVLKILNRSGAVVVPDYTRKSGMAFLAPSFGYAAHASLSLMAVHGMNIPMYAAIKRCSPLASLILSVVLLHKPIPSPKVVSSILIITVGCLVADLTFIILLIILLLMGLILNFLLFLCTALNSAVTTTIVGIPKSIIQTVVGFFVFGGVKYHPVNIIGIVMNTFGCVLYSCAKWEEQIKKKNKSDTNEPIDTNESVGLNK